MGQPVQLHVCTTWGTVELDLTDEQLTACRIPFLAGPPEIPFAVSGVDDHPLAEAAAALLQGRPVNLPHFPFPDGTSFQCKVWRCIATIPRGHVLTYGDLARGINQPKAVRAAASACGRNPLPLFIPCHRVVGAAGSQGGYSAGLAWKKLLLSSEI